MGEQMLNHGLDEPLLSADTGYFQVRFPGPGGNLDRIRAPSPLPVRSSLPRSKLNGTNARKKMVSFLTAGEKLTSRSAKRERGNPYGECS